MVVVTIGGLYFSVLLRLTGSHLYEKITERPMRNTSTEEIILSAIYIAHNTTAMSIGCALDW